MSRSLTKELPWNLPSPKRMFVLVSSFVLTVPSRLSSRTLKRVFRAISNREQYVV